MDAEPQDCKDDKVRKVPKDFKDDKDEVGYNPA